MELVQTQRCPLCDGTKYRTNTRLEQVRLNMYKFKRMVGLCDCCHGHGFICVAEEIIHDQEFEEKSC